MSGDAPSGGSAATGETAPGAGAPLPPEGRVVVVGASLAGLRAVEGLRDQGFGGEITLVGEELHLPYDRPPLSKQVLAGTWPPERAVLADRAKLDSLRVDQRLGRRAAALDAERAAVELDDGSVLQADGVVVATGAHPRRLPGTDEIEAVAVLRTLDDSLALRERVLAAGPRSRVVVVGAGFIGSEVASTCADLGCRVTVLEALDTPLVAALGPEIGAACAALHGEHGVELRTGTGVTWVRPKADNTGATVGLSDGEELTADVVVVGIGVVPTVDWLAGSGLEIDDGVVCDAALFAADRVVAAGDLARWRWRRAGGDGLLRIEHWELAAQMGAAAARSLLAGRGSAAPFEPVPYFWSDQYGLRIQMIGHPDATDEVDVVYGSLRDHKFVACYHRHGMLTGTVGISSPRQLMAYRPLLAAGASWDEARAISWD